MFKNGCSEYVLVEIKDNTIIDYYFMWNNIKNIVLESFLNYSLFDAINDSHTFIKYCDINPNIKTDRINILIAKLYNEIVVLNHCSSYEELAMKMDLLGI
jgi:hypothetical protein